MFQSIRKLLWLVLFVLQSGAATYGKSPDLKAILNRGVLIVGVCKIDQPPFYERDKKGVLKGIDIDIARDLAEGLGVKLRFDESAENWDDLVELLKEGKIDLAVSFLSKTVQRAKSILFSQPYSKLNQAFLVNRLLLQQAITKGTQTLENLFKKGGGQTLALYDGSSYIKFATKLFKDVSLAPYKTLDEIINAIISGKNLAFISDQLEIKNYIDANPEAKLKLIPLLLKENFDLISIGVAPDNYPLLHFVNTYLQANDVNVDINKLPRDSNATARLARETSSK